jgi:hypothetical protein
MTESPHEPKGVSRLEAWAFALATALVVLIAVGVVPRLHGERTASISTTTSNPTMPEPAAKK